MENAFWSALTSNAAINALIATRLFPDEFPQDPTFPCATYQTISAPREYTQEGPDRVTRFRVQLRIRALTPAAATAVKDAFLSSPLHGRIGQSYGSPAVKLHAIFVDNETSEVDTSLQANGTKLYGMRLDLIVWASEPVI